MIIPISDNVKYEITEGANHLLLNKFILINNVWLFAGDIRIYKEQALDLSILLSKYIKLKALE